MLFSKKALLVFSLVRLICGFLMQANASEGQVLRYKIITHSQLKALLDTKTKNIQIIDARNPEEFEDVHIPEAVNIPQKKFDQYVHLLPKDKTTQLVFYCNGVKCGKSKKAALLADKMGYANVYVFSQGMPVWEEVGYPIVKGSNYETKIETTKISPQDLDGLMQSGEDNFIIVDVRDKSEYIEGHVPGAINIPVASFSIDCQIGV